MWSARRTPAWNAASRSASTRDRRRRGKRAHMNDGSAIDATHRLCADSDTRRPLTLHCVLPASAGPPVLRLIGLKPRAALGAVDAGLRAGVEAPTLINPAANMLRAGRCIETCEARQQDSLRCGAYRVAGVSWDCDSTKQPDPGHQSARGTVKTHRGAAAGLLKGRPSHAHLAERVACRWKPSG